MRKYLVCLLLPLLLLGCRTSVSHDPLEDLVDSVYERLSLEERVAQLYGIYPQEIMEDGRFSLEKCRERLPYGVGHICQFACSLDMDADELREFVRQVQDYLMNETPSGIPAIFHDEAITGIAALVRPMALAATAAGADGLMIEVHNDPAHALSDGAQSLKPEEFSDLMGAVKAIRPYSYQYHKGL